MEIIITIMLLILIAFAINTARVSYSQYGCYDVVNNIKLRELLSCIKVIENGSVDSRVDISMGNTSPLFIEKKQNEEEWWYELTIIIEEKEKIEAVFKNCKNSNLKLIGNAKILLRKAHRYKIDIDSKELTDVLKTYFITYKKCEQDSKIRYRFVNTYTASTVKNFLEELQDSIEDK